MDEIAATTIDSIAEIPVKKLLLVTEMARWISGKERKGREGKGRKNGGKKEGTKKENKDARKEERKKVRGKEEGEKGRKE